jgi:NAD(P)-dependent dehydrogenase (short-subunit alcohol dehydrogenase family)
MARVFITGSSDGLGLMAAGRLSDEGHEVVLHARNEARARDARAALPRAVGVAIGDLSTLAGMRQVAQQANAAGPFQAVIHNAAVGYREPRRVVTSDGLAQVFAVNALAPYVLTALIRMPQRLVYLSSGLHRNGDPALDDLQWERRRWSGFQAYSDSKLFDATLAFAVARLRPDVLSNAVDPGWVATKMGGPGAPDDLVRGSETQAWLAVSADPAARASGRYWFHKYPRETHPAVRDVAFQDELLQAFAQLSGVRIPSLPPSVPASSGAESRLREAPARH